ncbi:MAG: hypothetical protein NPIRA04_17990 [Nitrospirales bacterium]|nr:MAG: hypothetical protein NPIRA04_17990 [Nitrospirales bacterium]
MPMVFTTQDQTIVRIPSVLPCVIRLHWILFLVLICSGVVGCTTDSRYREEYKLQQLNVVFLDQQTLHEEWANRTGQSGVQFMPSHGGNMPSLKTLRGFFDFTTNTLYCPKWNFAVCGHELHHAALGHFHDKE